MTDLFDVSATGLTKFYGRRSVSQVEVARAVLGWIDAEHVLSQAAQSERR
jgi:hypothetical protein